MGSGRLDYPRVKKLHIRRIVLIFFLTLYPLYPADAIRDYVQTHQRSIVEEFATLIEIPNNASDLPNIEKNAALIRSLFEKRGVPTRLLRLKNYPPIVLGEIKTPGAKRTINLYAHYDGQPVDAKEWANQQPFHPELRTARIEDGGKVLPLLQDSYQPGWRIFSRSSSDDKGPILAMAIALDAMKAAGVQHRANVRFFFGGEEEAGSTHLTEYLRAYRDQLLSDLWIICDGPIHQNRQQSVVFGVRGVTTLELTVFGPKRELHSGHYGGWVANPAQRLSRLLASLSDGEGHILVKDFYQGIVPFNAAELRALAAIPAVEDSLKEELGLADVEGDGLSLAATYGKPTLNIRGIRSVDVGKAGRNVIPSEASASLDIRLVKGLDWRRQIDRVRAHIAAQGYLVLEREPSDDERRKNNKIVMLTAREGYNSIRTPLDLPIAKDVVRAVESAAGKVVLIPSHGGSVPLAMFDEVMKTPLILVPTVNHDNNQHSRNENLRLENLWNGIAVMAALLNLQ